MISNLIVGPQCEEEEEACPTCNAIMIINVSSLVTIIIITSQVLFSSSVFQDFYLTSSSMVLIKLVVCIMIHVLFRLK